jgi:hypothetical protein
MYPAPLFQRDDRNRGVPRDDMMDNREQLTYLLFLKMTNECTKPLPDMRHL